MPPVLFGLLCPAACIALTAPIHLHFITCSCYRRLPFLRSVRGRDRLLSILEQTRRRYQFVVVGYVIMPEHIHLLITEPEIGTPSTVMQVLKQRTARALLPNKKRADRARAFCLETLLCAQCSGRLVSIKFTGKERDTESGLDYFGARYNASSMGRFMTPDSIAYSGLDDPQSLNLYSYVGNHPTSMIDPDGRCWGLFGWACKGYQRFANWADGNGFRTDKQLDNTSPGNDPTSRRRRQQEAEGNASRQASLFAATGMAFTRWGRLGGPAHRAAVRALSDHWEAQGYTVTTEEKIDTPRGAKSYRFADVYGTKTNPDGTKSTRIGQIGRTYADGSTPVAREQSALSDIQAAEPNASVEFYDYQAPFPEETGIPGWPVQAAPLGIPAVGEDEVDPVDPEILP